MPMAANDTSLFIMAFDAFHLQPALKQVGSRAGWGCLPFMLAW